MNDSMVAQQSTDDLTLIHEEPDYEVDSSYLAKGVRELLGVPLEL